MLKTLVEAKEKQLDDEQVLQRAIDSIKDNDVQMLSGGMAHHPENNEGMKDDDVQMQSGGMDRHPANNEENA